MSNPDASVVIEVSPEWLAIAEQFAAEQTQATQQELIFQQTLAVLGLEKYLALGEIQTAREESYSWHPQTRTLTAWADLLLPEYGRLLCCFADASQQISLPPILPLNTFGFVVVEVETNFSQIYLKGFLPHRSLLDNNSYFEMAEVQVISTLFDELFLLTEKRLMVETEIYQMISDHQELHGYLSPLLVSENIVDIVGRLNRSLALDEVEPNYLLLGQSDHTEDFVYAAAESTATNYGDRATQEKIKRVTTQLTASLLTKVQALEQEFEVTPANPLDF